MTTLILTPTALELRVIETRLASVVENSDVRIEVCGFGAIAAAARSMQMIAKHQPVEVVLVGIAGSLRPESQIGTAWSFPEVACAGIGVGTGLDHQPASEMGWKHWSCSGSEEEPQQEIGDVLALSPRLASEHLGGTLLSVCSASANPTDAARHAARYPRATAEDMEGFAVTVSCCLANVPLQIIRGISNRAGDRDKRNWDIEGTLQAAASLLLKSISA